MENKNMAKIFLGLVVFAAFFVLTIAPVFAAVSDTDNTTVSVDVAETISIDSTSGTVSINVTPTGGGATATGNDTVIVSTNDAAGYVLNLKDSNTSLNLNDGGSNNIPPLTIAGNCTTAWTQDEALDNDSWGYKADANGDANEYCPILTSSGAGHDIYSIGSAISSDSTTITYAVKATTALPSGTYTDTVLYTATGQTP